MFEYKDIIFKAVEEEDLKFLFDMRQDEKINDNLFHHFPISLYGQSKWLESITFNDKRKVFIVNSNNDQIGCARLTDIDYLHRKIEIGADVCENFRRQGYGKKIYEALIKYCFEHLNMNKIYLYSFEKNKAVKLYKDVGFEIEGILKEHIYKHGKFQNVLLMALFKKDYK